jgi:ribosomal protein S18 acetylase RimI-like enzyme
MSDTIIQIKVLGDSDEQVLERVEPDVFDHGVQPQLAARFLREPGNLLAVALADGVVVGMASGIVYVHPDKPLQLFVNEVGVSAKWQRRGIGKRLLAALLDHGQGMGCREAWVATEVDNEAARALYQAAQGKEDADRAVVYTWKLREDEAETDCGRRRP